MIEQAPQWMSIEWWEVFLGGVCTLAIFSFLYRENMFYRFFEHFFIGIATAYGIVFSVKEFLWPEGIPAAARHGSNNLSGRQAMPSPTISSTCCSFCRWLLEASTIYSLAQAQLDRSTRNRLQLRRLGRIEFQGVVRRAAAATLGFFSLGLRAGIDCGIDKQLRLLIHAVYGHVLLLLHFQAQRRRLHRAFFYCWTLDVNGLLRRILRFYGALTQRHSICVSCALPMGSTSRPPGASCGDRASGTRGGAAVTMMASNGASSGQPA